MAATRHAKKNRPKRARGSPRSGPPLTPAQEKFRDLLRECLPQERDFIRHKLGRKNNTEAAILAGYSAKTADVQGAQLLARLRVWDAYQAGLEAAGFGALDVLDDIQALRSFDRSQIEREVLQRVTELVERRAEDVIQELLTRERSVQDMLEGIEPEEDEDYRKLLKDRLKALRRERLELQEEVNVDPEATVIRSVVRAVTNRVIDFDLARDRGLLRFIKGRKHTAYGEIIEVHDWVEGVDMGARAQGVYRDRHELTGKDGAPLASATVLVLPNNARPGVDE